jgi:hypothetical protein
VDLGGGVREQPPQDSRAAVAEHCAVPAGEYRSQFPRAFDRRIVTQEIDAAVERVQPAGSEPLVDRTRSQSDVEKLAARDDAALTRGKLCDRPLAPCARRENLGLMT